MEEEEGDRIDAKAKPKAPSPVPSFLRNKSLGIKINLRRILKMIVSFDDSSILSLLLKKERIYSSFRLSSQSFPYVVLTAPIFWKSSSVLA